MNDISNAIFNIRKIDELGDKFTIIHRIDSSIKIIVTIIYVIKVLSIKEFIAEDIIFVLIYTSTLFIFGKVPLKFILKKVLFVLPIVMGLSVINLIIDFSYAEIYFSLVLLFKCIFSLIGALLLIVTTGINNLVCGLKKLKIPNILTMQILMLYRYIILIMEEFYRVKSAYELRTIGEKSMTMKDYGQIIGQMLLKTIDRSEKVYESMKLRGFEGDLYISSNKRAGYIDFLYLITFTVILIFL
ncbi:energy-coupling factor transporter transmembrane component T [Clostridium sp. AL.422]|uniref:energy-coupling factor transporter transmembrane component T family protein n=1 Tax=Clostridium TaxID=1485 RepID=UPI00293DCA6E|nr:MULTISPECIES: energy-coupling factor transporter transmembrane component T [unclassified Clostridium]MDV4151829.1 energy-coupling factor transporter transmembrane component T [Clostridium sp. AL.422]